MGASILSKQWSRQPIPLQWTIKSYSGSNSRKVAHSQEVMIFYMTLGRLHLPRLYWLDFDKKV